MATYNLGQAAIVMKGAYASGTAYLPLNCVSNDGGSWICKKACTGIEPGVTSGWATYWVAAAVGIKNINISSATAGTATVVITFTDNSTLSFTYDTSAIAAGGVGTTEIADKAVTPEKLDRFYLSIGTRPAISADEDLDDYTSVGYWACKTSTIGASLKNCPVSGMFALDVQNVAGGTATTKPSSGNYYIVQRITTPTFKEWRRYIQQSGTTIYKGDWVRVLTTEDIYSPVSGTGASAAYSYTVDDIGVWKCPGSGAANVDVVYTIPADVSEALPMGAELIAYWRYGKSLKVVFESGARSAMEGDTAFVNSRTYALNERFAKAIFKKVDYATGVQYWDVTGPVEVVA